MKELDWYVSSELSSKNYIDPTCNVVFPWFTKPFLDVLETWDLSNAEIFEWGTGHSTIWFATKCKHLVSIETSKEWCDAVKKRLIEKNLTNVEIFNYTVNTPEEREKYDGVINRDDKKYDFISIDGSRRNQCGAACVNHVKPGSIVILDNANQASIGENHKPIFDVFAKYKHFSFLHPWHKHGDWRTDYWVID